MTENREEYSLVPSYDEEGVETGYYTREPDGTSGMTVSALAEFCGTSQPVITNLLNRIRDADPISNNLEDSLKPYSGEDLRLISNDLQGRRIIPDEVCQAIAEYYAFEAREYSGKEIAIENFRTAARAGIRVFIWSKTGFVPELLRPSLKSNTTVYIERLENIRDHIVPDDKWTTFREGAEILLLVEKEMGVPVDRLDLCDGSIGSHWSKYREDQPWAVESGFYTHVFRDHRGPREARAYDLAELSYFRRWLADVYIPHHLPKYLADKHGKLAVRQIYQEMRDINPRVEQVTEVKRMTPKQEQQHAEFLELRERLLPGFQPQYRIDGDN